MANIGIWATEWEGTALQPGAQHNWWWVHSQWIKLLPHFQVNVSAHPWNYGPFTPPPPAELTVLNVRSHINSQAKPVLYFTVKNTGPNPVRVYEVAVSVVTA